MMRFKQVTIVGLGLMGGSLGMALRRRRLAHRVIGLSRSAATVRQAKRRGAIDGGTTDARRAVRDAQLVVLATPVDAIAPHARRLARFMRPGSILTDVGSTKSDIVRTLEQALPRTVAFVGAHPIAGSEQRGLGAAHERLFDGSICIVTPTTRTARRALHTVVRFWRPLVKRVMTMSPQEHDRVLAGTSHLAHLLAYCLARASHPALLPHAPRSFLEMTRLAQSDPDLWDDIFLSNRAALLAALARFDRELRALRSLIAQGRRGELKRFLAAAKSKRDVLQDR